MHSCTFWDKNVREVRYRYLIGGPVSLAGEKSKAQDTLGQHEEYPEPAKQAEHSFRSYKYHIRTHWGSMRNIQNQPSRRNTVSAPTNIILGYTGAA